MTSEERPSNRRAQFVRASGNYRLNQTSAIFADKRTKRRRDRSTQKNESIKESKE